MQINITAVMNGWIVAHAHINELGHPDPNQRPFAKFFPSMEKVNEYMLETFGGGQDQVDN